MNHNQNILPKISIVIPSYNKVKYIEDTLASIVEQKYPNLEIIIQDGGSTDGTLDVIKKYAKNNKDVINWFSEKDGGQTDAINKGFKKTTGEILTFINADDLYKNKALHQVAKLFADFPDTLWVAGQGNIINDAGQEYSKFVTFYKNILLRMNNRNLLLIVNYLVQPSVFFSRQAYNKYGPFMGVGKYVLEYDFWMRLSKNQMPKVLPAYLSSFRLTADNASATSFKQLLGEDLQIAKKHTSNPIIIPLHYLHNLMRTGLITLLKRYD